MQYLMTIMKFDKKIMNQIKRPTVLLVTNVVCTVHKNIYRFDPTHGLYRCRHCVCCNTKCLCCGQDGCACDYEAIEEKDLLALRVAGFVERRNGYAA